MASLRNDVSEMASLTLTLNSLPPCTLPRPAAPDVTSKCDVTFCDVTISGDVTLLRGRHQRHNGNAVARRSNDAVAARPPVTVGVVSYRCATNTNVWRQIYTGIRQYARLASTTTRRCAGWDVESKSTSKGRTTLGIVAYYTRHSRVT